MSIHKRIKDFAVNRVDGWLRGENELWADVEDFMNYDLELYRFMDEYTNNDMEAKRNEVMIRWDDKLGITDRLDVAILRILKMRDIDPPG